VFTARYALSPYIKQIRFVFKGLKIFIDATDSEILDHNMKFPYCCNVCIFQHRQKLELKYVLMLATRHVYLLLICRSTEIEVRFTQSHLHSTLPFWTTRVSAGRIKLNYYIWNTGLNNTNSTPILMLRGRHIVTYY
jgi:hypothetical protein